MSWLFGALAGFLTGVISGFGVGGGTLLILWLTLAGNMDQLRAGGVNLLYFISCALPAIVGHIKNGLVENQAVLWCTIWGLPACIGGALAAAAMETGLLRRIFGVLLLVVGVKELFYKDKRES